MSTNKHYIDVVLEKERLRNESMINAYEKRLSELPRGSLTIRELNGKKYCYLRYRTGKKVIQEYVGTIRREEEIRTQIEEREHLLKLIEMLKAEKMRIIKMGEIQ